MTPEQIRIAVAEEMGMVAYDERPDYGFTAKDGKACNIPNYPESLDACAEFERTLKDADRSKYCRILVGICNADLEEGTMEEEVYEAIVATALQKCEAFLRLRNKWKD